MASNFPNPNEINEDTGALWESGDTWTDSESGVIYIYDPIFGVPSWRTDYQSVYNDKNRYVELVGDNMVGDLTLADDRIRLSTSGAAEFAGGQTIIDSSGNVGVGTSSPGANLEVAGSEAEIRLRDTRVDDAGYWGFKSELSNGQRKLFIQDDDTNKITLDAAGNVGIGIDSVSATRRVEIEQPSSYSAALRIRGDGNGNDGDIEWFTGLSQYGLGITQGTDAIRLRRNSAELLRIDSSGRLLVGTSSASGDALLQVNGPLQVQDLRIAYHARGYTASTSATDLFKVRMTTGHTAADLTWTFVDPNYPNGVRIGKIYLATTGSGSNITAVNITSSTEASRTNGNITGISWSASVYDVNHIKLTVTGTTASSGAGTMYIFGSSPFFDGLTPISDV